MKSVFNSSAADFVRSLVRISYYLNFSVFVIAWFRSSNAVTVVIRECTLSNWLALYQSKM